MLVAASEDVGPTNLFEKKNIFSWFHPSFIISIIFSQSKGTHFARFDQKREMLYSICTSLVPTHFARFDQKREMLYSTSLVPHGTV